MYKWPNWVYTIWAYFIIVVLFPVVLPVRIFDYVVSLFED